MMMMMMMNKETEKEEEESANFPQVKFFFRCTNMLDGMKIRVM